ncbi:MAG: hypothetical protein V2I33_01770, partial [Kangiellaceae bacterium]|nr:hypothetical protein [Kangiellaceae bacterium]
MTNAINRISRSSKFLTPLLLSLFMAACGSDNDNSQPEVAVPEPPVILIQNENDAVKFLSRATFGPTQPDINRLLELDAEAWIEQQFNITPSNHLQRLTDTYIAN